MEWDGDGNIDVFAFHLIDSIVSSLVIDKPKKEKGEGKN